MKITIDTTPEQDAALTIARDESNIGQGAKEPQELEEFTAAFLTNHLNSLVKAADYKQRDDLKRAVDSADPQKLAAIAAAAR